MSNSFKQALTGLSKDGKEGNSTDFSSRPNLTINPTASFDNSPLQITPYKLNGRNFLQWSRTVQMVIRGRGKIGFIDGTTKRPDPTDPTYAAWDTQNALVMAWLINSMEEHIGSLYLVHSTAKVIWDKVRLAYSDLENSAQLCELRDRARELKQGDMDVTEYYTNLTKIWQELDLFEPNDWCGECAGKYVKLVEKTRTYDFLAGLNKDLDEVRGRIIGIRPLPQIEEVFAAVRREESRRKIMLGDSRNSDSRNSVQTETSALVSKSYEQNRKSESSTESRRAKKGNLWCDFCQKTNHTRETCWKIHGKPPNQNNRENQRQPRQFQKESRAYQSSIDHTGGSLNLTKEQLERLYKLLTPEKVNGTSLIAQQGNFLSALNCKKEVKNCWIIDSGASDHMTGCAHLFSSYVPNSGHTKVRIADGSLSPIAGIGTVKINSTLALKSVLHVPNLSCNLLSVSKICKDCDCKVIFSQNHCEFQDQSSGKRIGNASEYEGLYYFGEGTDEIKQVNTVSWETSSRQNQVILWHYRLGHPSFAYLKHLFPSLFKNNDIFHCEICQFAKHQRSVFKPKPYKATKPFAMIHSDI